MLLLFEHDIVVAEKMQHFVFDMSVGSLEEFTKVFGIPRPSCIPHGQKVQIMWNCYFMTDNSSVYHSYLLGWRTVFLGYAFPHGLFYRFHLLPERDPGWRGRSRRVSHVVILQDTNNKNTQDLNTG